MELDSEGSRTVVVSGVPDVLPTSRMIDKLIIHFQSCRRSHGGDVEMVKYPTALRGVAFVTFDKAEDAEQVVQKQQQILTDEEFPEDYLLTVFPFTQHVSLFSCDQALMIQSLRSAPRSVRFQH
ncbi:hypothetical protein LDENG_00042060 [Lucifuga dentata]|nr:hypothetical protein LDENG_00042060 [Lucifuga dentata]